ncbi:beta-ketoacyl synthase N-terminal-like domain-containing protein [Mycobacterium europaeum]|uniref:type I polyketide synthase n=1 Tax=Mycobacterium europaeum TaxID=761804 RepID=UPI002ADF849F|nr:beta-ketoacyl synthase N-terminal-like domain-containing protein [Mycobacterium europaeum]MEA1162159.1 acyltransferase domain-containing protein [Mycobacterium europaeum]
MTDVAIIGLACRFPGAENPRDLWGVLRDGREAARLPGDIAEFDADFFHLSPREAGAMDPRQRLALELAWEAFEDAFVVAETVRGESVAVYVGAMADDYAVLTLRDLADNLDHHSFAGISRGMIANRVSYALGLRGPSMTVDSGQSSSLTAVHLACESLRSGESALALAGGVHLNLADETAMLEREFGALSTSGHTYAFDRRADGYVRGEGGGLVLLKPLPAALRDGDRIHAVIRGSAVGNAGHSAAGQTVPSVSAEADVIRRALAAAGLGGGDIDYVEAHGTGTKVGDAAEAQALGEVFGGRGRPVNVGSVKTNIGHAGAAAGIAGLLKAVLAVRHSVIPPSLNHAGPDPELDRLGLRVNTDALPWPAAERPRRAGVSSFGMGGTNAHVVVEEAPAQPDTPADAPDGPVAWVLSARSAQALANQARRLAAWVADSELTAPDVAWSLVTTRSVFDHRAVLVGRDREALTRDLAGVAAGEAAPGLVVGHAGPAAKTAFVFPGQGSQWPGMGRRLHHRFPAFARAFDEAAAAMDAHLRVPLREVMWGDDAESLRDTGFAQPALFVLEVALAALWRSWGVVPDVVLGHSVGEIAAACVAGALSLDDAARIVAARGELMARLPAGGVMVAVDAGEAEVTPMLGADVSIAAVNAPNAVVLSGERAAVGAVADRLADTGHRTHRLAVSHAFHSPLMEPMLDEFAHRISGIQPRQPRICLISNVSGEPAGPGYGSARYWVEHVRRPVRFLDGVRAAEALGVTAFAEMGPGGGLSPAVDQSLTTQRPISAVTMPKDGPEVGSLLYAAGRLFTAGVDVRWPVVLAAPGTRRVDLPTYGFARQRFWLGDARDAVPAKASQSPDLAERLHALAPADRQRGLVELVCEHVAAVSGHPDGSAIDRDRAFADLGFDSMTGVELRNRLTTATGLALSRTLIFDYPTPAALADHLRQQLFRGEDDRSDEDKLWSSLRSIPVAELRRTGLLDKLLLLAGGPESVAAEPVITGDEIDSLTPDALIAMALNAGDDESDGR